MDWSLTAFESVARVIFIARARETARLILTRCIRVTALVVRALVNVFTTHKFYLFI